MTAAHFNKRTLTEIAAYPPHGPRDSDPNYKVFHAARHHLVDVLGVGCWIGGATKAEIKAGLPEDHLCYGALGLEGHHALAEFASLNAIDWTKIAKDFPQLGIDSDEDFLKAAEDEGGLLILCSKHHRGPYHGIHMITEPIWKLDRYARNDFRIARDPSEV